MPKGKNGTAKGTQEPIESTLWQAANKLRKNIDASADINEICYVQQSHVIISNMKFEWDPHTEKGEIIRIISARVASKGEKIYMKKVNQSHQDELRAEYRLTDFPQGMIRGKYSKRISESSNIVVLQPEVVDAFPNEEAVNSALISLIEIARKTTRKPKRSTANKKIAPRL